MKWPFFPLHFRLLCVLGGCLGACVGVGVGVFDGRRCVYLYDFGFGLVGGVERMCFYVYSV